MCVCVCTLLFYLFIYAFEIMGADSESSSLLVVHDSNNSCLSIGQGSSVIGFPL